MKEYTLYRYSKLGSQRKPSVTDLLLEQKENIIYDFRRKREPSRRNCNCIYFKDINKYCVIMSTLIKNSDISIGAVILDDENLVKELNLKDSSCMPNVNLYDTYRKKELPSPFSLGIISLEELNRVRKKVSEHPSWSYVKPMTEEEFKQPILLEYITLPYKCKE